LQKNEGGNDVTEKKINILCLFLVNLPIFIIGFVSVRQLAILSDTTLSNSYSALTDQAHEILMTGLVQNQGKNSARLPQHFDEIYLASRTVSKCEALQQEVGADRVKGVFAVDADNAKEVEALINEVKPDLVINLALPYQDLPIMDACLATNTDYLDTANYEPKDEAKIRILVAVGLPR
jgi:Saccharopine dehydrogenase and related proteins